jgi:hypothetical protein
MVAYRRTRSDEFDSVGIPSKVKGCVYSRLATRLAPGDSKQRLRLPRGLTSGTYTVKIVLRK